MESYAEMICILKVNIDCEECKTKIMDVLQSVRGVYSITIDAEEGIIEVSGRVNPNMLLRVLESSGQHAQLLKIRFDGEINNGSRSENYYYGDYGEIHDYNPYWSPCYQYQSYNILPPPPRPMLLPPPPPPPVDYFPQADKNSCGLM